MSVFVRAPLLIVALTLMALFWLAPLAMLPFSNILPFIPNMSMGAIAIFAIANAAIIVFSLWFGSSAKNKQLILSTFESNRDRSYVAVGVIVFTALSAFLSPNSLALLYSCFPTKPFISEYEVASKTERGSKFKTVTMQLKAPSQIDEYRLVLSKSAPVYATNLSAGDKIVIGGESNFVGRYVSRLIVIRRERSDPTI